MTKEAITAITPLACNAVKYLSTISDNGITCNAGLRGSTIADIPKTNNPIAKLIAFLSTIYDPRIQQTHKI